MLAAFKDYIEQTALFSPADKILLAVSGGVDSMVMARLFHAAGFKFGIAHCNFQLRADASDADEQLVKAQAAEWDVPFHVIQFKTKEESGKQQKSTELMARELRYKWFAELIESFDYQFLATAHHLNDSLETLLYNLAKGTGIRGLHGIPVKNNQTIRPLSFATREQIEQYAATEKTPFREDATNQSLEHNRNLIRHKIVPPLKEINPSLEQTFSKTLKQLKETEALFLWAVKEQHQKMITEEADVVKVNMVALKNAVAKSTVLFEIIYKYGFNSDHVDQIFRAIDNVGAQFYSKTHHILVGRKEILIQRKKSSVAVWTKIEMLPETINLPKGELSATILKERPTNLNLGKKIALVDLAKVKLPFIVRKWKEGDRFQPLGMKGKSKKVSEYLRDEKLSLFEKEAVLVLESEGAIVWVVGHRSDERFKITENTKAILRLNRS